LELPCQRLDSPASHGRSLIGSILIMKMVSVLHKVMDFTLHGFLNTRVLELPFFEDLFQSPDHSIFFSVSELM
jgi:hypothetical protein